MHKNRLLNSFLYLNLVAFKILFRYNKIKAESWDEPRICRL